MKLNERTLTVLKNFASINSGLVIRSGKVQKTVSPENTILVEAQLEDDFPETFGIYELNNFLGNVTTLSNPELDFAADSVVIKDGDIELNFLGSSTNLIYSPPEGKSLVMKDSDATFNLTHSTLQKLMRLANMNDLTHINIVGKGGEIYLKANDPKNDTSNSVSTKVGDYEGKDFSVLLKADNLKLIPDDYTVQVKVGGFTYWSNKSGTLKYYISLEKEKK